MAKKNAVSTEFAKESAALPDSPAATGPSAAMIALFKAPAGVDFSKAERLNLPQMIKPGEVPIFTEENQAVLAGEILKVTESPSTLVKGKCLWLKIGTEERLFPVTGVVRKALAPDCKADSVELRKALEKHIGRTVVLKRLNNLMNRQYQKEQYMFEVFLLK